MNTYIKTDDLFYQLYDAIQQSRNLEDVSRVLNELHSAVRVADDLLTERRQLQLIGPESDGDFL